MKITHCVMIQNWVRKNLSQHFQRVFCIKFQLWLTAYVYTFQELPWSISLVLFEDRNSWKSEITGTNDRVGLEISSAITVMEQTNVPLGYLIAAHMGLSLDLEKSTLRLAASCHHSPQLPTSCFLVPANTVPAMGMEANSTLILHEWGGTSSTSRRDKNKIPD